MKKDKKTQNVQKHINMKKIPHETFNTKTQMKRMLKFILLLPKIYKISDYDNVKNINGSLKIYNYFKKQHEYYLNYNSDGNSSL